MVSVLPPFGRNPDPQRVTRADRVSVGEDTLPSDENDHIPTPSCNQRVRTVFPDGVYRALTPTTRPES